MSSRKDIFVNGGFYHIYNKTIDRKEIFTPSFSSLFIKLMWYYRSARADIRYSYFVKLPYELRKLKERFLNNPRYFNVKIISYVVLPNHFHILLKQNKENGVIRFVSNILNSFTKTFNQINQRNGPIFLPQFKSKMVHSREQLIHLSRYIHLNPYAHGYIKTKEEILTYRFSSLKEFKQIVNRRMSLIDKEIILAEFQFNYQKYLNFILDHADYQRSLKKIKNLMEEL